MRKTKNTATVNRSARRAKLDAIMRDILAKYPEETRAEFRGIVEALRLSTGNKKLKNSKAVRFLIFNLPAVITCPYRTAHCEGSCYARKAERAYPTCLPCRLRNLEATRSELFTDAMIYLLARRLRSASYLEAVTVVRIHESGDFYSLDYLRKWCEVARQFDDLGGVVFMAYTKSATYFETLESVGYNIPECLRVRASVWDDTDPEQLAIIDRLGLPIYTAGDAREVAEALARGAVNCRCEDCGNCGKCWDMLIRALWVVIH